MHTLESSIDASWTRLSSIQRKTFGFLIYLFGLSGCVVLAQTNIDGPSATVVWAVILAFYFVFYRRIAQIVYWSNDTYRHLRPTLPGSIREPTEAFSRADLPTFHILIASYEAAESIGPVLRAIAHLDYPKDHYHAWVITERSELLKKEAQCASLLDYAGTRVTTTQLDPELCTVFWLSESERYSSLSAWVEQVTTGAFRPYLSHPTAPTLFLSDLLSRLRQVGDRNHLYTSGVLAPLQLRSKEWARLERALQRIETRSTEIAADFERLLGAHAIYCQEDIEHQLITSAVTGRSLHKIGRRACACLENADTEPAIQLPPKAQLAQTAKRMIRSTQAVVADNISNTSNIHHLDPHNRGFKPGALNAAFRHIDDSGLLRAPSKTFFIIIDADSLLPRHALREIVKELDAIHPQQPVMQMVSIPTANFFDAGWYSRFISFADAIGAVGKWARTTRQQLRPDLHAGSGVVVPASLAVYIAAAQGGKPWTETTLTEDARLIVGQFGMMNSVQNKTRIVPTYLLEAVPAEFRFRSTYKSFWNQRRRWTTGGFDELFYMLSAPDWLKFTRFDGPTQSWTPSVPDIRERMAARWRQLSRTTLWVWDHFWWGLGGAIILTHWWLISMAIAAPSSFIFWIGLTALLLVPLLFLSTSGRHLSTFIPGGLSLQSLAMLYLLSFVAIWIYCLPVVAIQLACIFGFRSRILEWKPTQKPKYDFDTVLRM